MTRFHPPEEHRDMRRALGEDTGPNVMTTDYDNRLTPREEHRDDVPIRWIDFRDLERYLMRERSKPREMPKEYTPEELESCKKAVSESWKAYKADCDDSKKLDVFLAKMYDLAVAYDGLSGVKDVMKARSLCKAILKHGKDHAGFTCLTRDLQERLYD